MNFLRALEIVILIILVIFLIKVAAAFLTTFNAINVPAMFVFNIADAPYTLMTLLNTKVREWAFGTRDYTFINSAKNMASFTKDTASRAYSYANNRYDQWRASRNTTPAPATTPAVGAPVESVSAPPVETSA